MRTQKKDLVSDELKPIIGNLIKENRIKYNYSLEDLSAALNHKKNRQTLHKYETGSLNIPYDIFFEICEIFNIDTSIIKEKDIPKEEQQKLESKFLKNYVNQTRNQKSITIDQEKILETYKNATYEALHGKSEFSIKILDDSMSPYYLKNDYIFFEKQKEYKNGDDIVIAIKNNVLSVRKLYKYPKGLILQAMNPKFSSLNINVMPNNMILGKVTAIYREVK